MNHTNPSPKSLCERMRDLWRTLTDLDRAYAYPALAALMTFAIEWLSRRSLSDTCLFLVSRPLAFLTNFALILITLLPVLLLRKRVAWLAVAVSLWMVLGGIQCAVLLNRVTPLTAADLAVALSVLSIISAYLQTWQIILIFVGLAGLITGLVCLFIKTRRRERRVRYFFTALIPTLLAGVLTVAAGFGSGQLSDRFPNLANAYNDYGFPYCFTMSLVDTGVDRPPDYGEELVTDILEDLGGSGDAPAVIPDEKAPNVIFVQLESFFDVDYLEGVTFSEDPTPTFTALKEQYPSGLLNVPVFGAGTVNTEFEVLTGMNVADFGAGEYPFRSVLLEKTCETVAYDLRASGYATHAIHNHEGSFYLRNQVYPNLGFDSFTSIEYFENPTFNENGWAHDSLLTNEILCLLQATEEPDFVFAVSVQAHGKYPDVYTSKATDVTVTGGIEDPATLARYNYFVNQLREVDRFLAELYGAIMAMEEDTVLLLYGDHLPNIAADEGITLSVGSQQTEYILLSNYALPAPPTGGERSAYELFPMVMEAIGNSEGIMTRFHRAYRDKPEFLSLLAALEYDVLYGERMFYGSTAYPPVSMSMGIRPVMVTDCYAEGEYIYIKGTGFTAYCHITLDGQEQETEFLDASTLRISCDDPERRLSRTEAVTVRVISGKNELLSESSRFWIHE